VGGTEATRASFAVAVLSRSKAARSESVLLKWGFLFGWQSNSDDSTIRREICRPDVCDVLEVSFRKSLSLMSKCRTDVFDQSGYLTLEDGRETQSLWACGSMI
jgi:hypothetical protein